MKKEYKNLLIKDVSCRLSYGIKVGTTDNDGSLENVWDILWYNTFNEDIKLINSIEDADKIVDISEIKPYLFPLSSMTEEQKKELFFNYIHNDIYFDDFTDYFLSGELWHDICVSMDVLPELPRSY